MMLLFSPCKRCPCPCSDAVLVKKHWLGSFSIVLPLVCVGSFRLRGTADTRAARGVGGREGGDTMGGSGGRGVGLGPKTFTSWSRTAGPPSPPSILLWDGVWVPSSACGVVVRVLGFWVSLELLSFGFRVL